MESVFSEIFSFRVPGGEVFMQRRFELSPDWAGGLKSLPIVSDRSTSGTLFVLPADAVLLFRAGALTLPAGGTYSVQFHGSGKYFDTPAEALAYMAKRWPVPFSLCSSPTAGPPPLPRAFPVWQRSTRRWPPRSVPDRAQFSRKFPKTR